MPMLPVQARWRLDTTDNGLFSALKEFLSTATNDDVQLIPLATCRAFGDTLAICSETVKAVETNLFRDLPPPALLAFLPASSVGFAPDDTAEALSSTLSGQRFLCLAAALVTSVGPFDGAQAIIDMMHASKAYERQYIPTLQQLADILKSLDGRSAFCGFAELMVKWEIVLREKVFPHLFGSIAAPGSTSNQATLGDLRNLILKGLPPPETIARIVAAFNKVASFMYQSIAEVEIKVGAGAAWVLAFAQWCFGTRPALYMHLDGEHIHLNSSTFLVKVTIPASSSNKSIDIVIRYRGESLPYHPPPAVKFGCYGMVSMKSYGKWLLHEFGFADESGRQLLRELLQHAIPQVLPKMTCGEFGRLGQNSDLVENYSDSDPSEFNHPIALPDISKLQKICNMITGNSVHQKFTMCQDAKSVIRHYLLVKRPMNNNLKRKRRSADGHGRDGNSTSEPETCAVEELYLNFSTILVDIFALSLFEAPESLLVRPSHDRHDGKQLRDTVRDVLQSGEPRVFEDGHLLQWARAMVGHVFDDKDRRLIVTSGRGQVVYPSAYGSRIERVGYLCLSNLRGVLKYGGDVYNVVASPDNDVSDVSDDQKQYIYESNQNPEILQPMNLYQNASVSWKIAIHDSGKIQANFSVHIEGRSFTAMRNSSFFITALKNTLFYEDCLHDSRARLEEADRFITNQPPWHEVVAENDENSLVNIIAVDGSEGLRRFALAHANGPVVLRRYACLHCCLDLCRRTAARRLIL